MRMKEKNSAGRVVLTLILMAVLLALAAGGAAEDTEWTCSKCGTVNTTQFCTRCGQNRLEGLVCPECGNVYPDDPEINFCGGCGTALRGTAAKPASRLWDEGEAYLTRGENEKAIDCFEQARALDEAEGVFDADRMMMLGSAYEAAGQTEDAAALYEMIYMKEPGRADAYQAHIRILQNSEDPTDHVRAGEVMKAAYESTKNSEFLFQRQDYLPIPPEVNLAAAYYEEKKYLTLSSPQGYAVYYTFDDDARIPYECIRYSEPILLEEGTWNLRAVCLNGELLSDVLTGTYRISMPKPTTPQANLAPNTYKHSQTVRLKPGKDNINDDDIQIYYTIDGSDPNSDSPIYDGEPIKLPNGNVTLKAVAVNQYGKISNMLEIRYKIEANPKPKTAFTDEDTIDRIRFGATTEDEFFDTYGKGEDAGEVKYGGNESAETGELISLYFDDSDTGETGRRYDYDWGYAVMIQGRKNRIVGEVCYTAASVFAGPRGTDIGNKEEEVTYRFRDMGQVESRSSGNRGLYYNDKGRGKIWQQKDGSRIIRYTYEYDNHRLELEYYVKDDAVYRIRMRYIL